MPPPIPQNTTSLAQTAPVKEETLPSLSVPSNVIKPQPVPPPVPAQPVFNYDTLSTTNATIASRHDSINKPIVVQQQHHQQQQLSPIQQQTHPQSQLKTNKQSVPNVSETILYKKDKPAKQEEFINAWCSSNEPVKPKSSSPPSLPFLTQIQHQIQKLQKKTSLNSNDAKPQVANTSCETNQIQSKISCQLSDKYVADLDYQQSSNCSATASVNKAQNEVQIPQVVRQHGKNMFQLKTKKGKALQFTITSDDPTESDIEEVKYIINKSIENLADTYDFEDKNSFSRNKQSTQSAQNFSDHYAKSSSFQPSHTQIALSQETSSSCSSSSSTTVHGQVPKSGSIGCFKTSEPKNFLSANNSQIKHYPNMNPVNNSTKIYHVDQDEKRCSKNIYSNNSGSNENLYAKHSSNVNQYQTHESLAAKKHTNSTRFEKNAYLRRSNSFGNGQESTSSDTDVNYNRNTTAMVTTTAHTKPKSSIKTSNSRKQTIFNGGTYTKSTINFTCQSYDSDFNEIDNSSSKKHSSRHTSKSKSKSSNSNYNQMNKSTNNIYDSNVRDVTPEMTEQLLLKLLLQQISQKEYNLPSFKKLNHNMVKDDYSSSSTIYNKNIVSETASLMMSPVDSSYSSKFNSIKNKLTHKSKNNFEFEVDDDYDDITSNNQYRRYQQPQLATKTTTTSQYLAQQQLLMKKPSQQQAQSSKSKKFNN